MQTAHSYLSGHILARVDDIQLVRNAAACSRRVVVMETEHVHVAHPVDSVPVLAAINVVKGSPVHVVK